MIAAVKKPAPERGGRRPCALADGRYCAVSEKKGAHASSSEEMSFFVGLAFFLCGQRIEGPVGLKAGT